MPRLTAVCTCSRSLSSRIAALVTRATMASEEIARAIAGSVKCRRLLTKSVPLPSAGNQPSFTANTRISTIAATNAGMAAEIAVTTRVQVSSEPGPQAGQDAQADPEHQDQHRRVQDQPGGGPDPGRDQAWTRSPAA